MGRLKLIKERINMPMPNYLVDDFHWLVEQAEKVERYEKALNHIATRKMSTYLSTSHMNQDFIKTAIRALDEYCDIGQYCDIKEMAK